MSREPREIAPRDACQLAAAEPAQAVQELLIVGVRNDRFQQLVAQPAFVGGFVQVPRSREQAQPAWISQAGVGNELASHPDARERGAHGGVQVVDGGGRGQAFDLLLDRRT